jgi:hypothetical protein
VSQLDAQPSEQLWALGESGWTLLGDDGPPPVVVTGAAWNPERNVLVRYGGLPIGSHDCVPETWEWDGAGWALPPTLENPGASACDHTKLVYDPTLESVLMVGGGDDEGNLTQETWSWDGRDWSLVANGGPVGRAHHSLVWDEGHSQVLLYGGYDGTSVFDDFWTWDGEEWNELAISGVGARSHHGMAISDQAELLLFGGATGPRSFETMASDTWILTDGSWHELDVEGPSARLSPALGFDTARGVWVLYGGFDASGDELADTWQFDGSTWQCVDGCEV